MLIMKKDIKLRFESFYIILPIIFYLFGVSISDYISKFLIGIPYSFNAIYEVLAILVTICILNKKKLLKKYGIFIKEKSNKVILFITLIVMPLVNLIFGFSINYSLKQTLLILITMIGTGFMEEILFRSHLIRQYQKFGDTYAVLLSSMIFSLLHILNITSGMDIFVNILQIISSFMIGIMFSTIFIKTDSIVLCIMSHSLINISSMFTSQSLNKVGFIVIDVIYIFVSLLVTIYIYKRENKVQ